MRRPFFPFLALVLVVARPFPAIAQLHPEDDPSSRPDVARAIAQGDALSAQQRFEEALAAYRSADDLAHHSCGVCNLRMVAADREIGDLDAALKDAMDAARAAQNDSNMAAQAFILHGILLGEIAGESGDPRLRQAEDDFRRALVIDPLQSVARYNLGVALIRDERDADGVAELKTFIRAKLAEPSLVEKANKFIADPVSVRRPSAPEFSFNTIQGATISNRTLQGKVVLIDFWATWCPPCRASIPTLVALHNKYAQSGFELVSISGDDDEREWREFIREQHMDWAEYIDLSHQIRRIFETESFPTYVIFDRNGQILYRRSGFGPTTPDELDSAIHIALERPFTPRVAATPAAAAAPPQLALPRPSNAEIQIEVPPEDVQNGDVTGNLYRNDFLGLSYRFPESWVALTPDAIDGLNATALERMKESRGTGNSVSTQPDRVFFFPATVFSASPAGERGVSVRITIARGTCCLTFESVRADAENWTPLDFELKLLGPPQELSIRGRQFFRSDYEIEHVNPAGWFSRIETVTVSGYRVTLLIQARSRAELDRLAATSQSFEFSKR